MNKLKINSIYRATEGEGIFIGTPQVFVRFQGCAIGCVNCDSLETWDFDHAHLYSVEEVIEQVEKELGDSGIKRISITGGDPLHPIHSEGLLALVQELKLKGFYLNIEAAGSRIDNKVFDLVDYISMDYKSISTGVKTKLELLAKLNRSFKNKFQIKTVIQDRQDFDDVYSAYNELLSMSDDMDFDWCLTPSFLPGEGESFLERFQEVINFNMGQGSLFRVIGQQHKWIFGPSIKNV